MTEGDGDPRAGRRFALLSLASVGGAIVAALGLLMLAGLFHAPRTLALGLTVAGLVVHLVLPLLLRHRWRSGPR